MKKTISIALAAAALTCGVASGCNTKTPLDPQHGTADQSKLFGMCYLLEERSVESLNIEKEVELMKNMGVKTVRQWMHFTHFLKSPTETKQDNQTTENMHKLLAECEKAGMVNIGYNYNYFRELFYEKKGVSLKDYLTEKKISCAENVNLTMTLEIVNKFVIRVKMVSVKIIFGVGYAYA